MQATGTVTGRVFDIQRFSLHDGPGIRTTVFLKGCPLRCAWCHNPEGIDPGLALAFQPERCIGCGYCFRVCPEGAHRMEDGVHVLDRERCVLCGECVKECYSGALELVGKEVTAAEVMEEVLRDMPFYETSGGGMTLSGGEPLQQIDFTAGLLTRAKREGLHCCVDTCGFVPYERLERVLPQVDLFLFDWKESDPARHEELTGVRNEKIRQNLRRLHDDGALIRLRCPIIPGVNDREEHFAGIAELAHSLPELECVELLPYHPLGEGKMDRFGLEQPAGLTAESPASETVEQWEEHLSALEVNVLTTK